MGKKRIQTASQAQQSCDLPSGSRGTSITPQSYPTIGQNSQAFIDQPPSATRLKLPRKGGTLGKVVLSAEGSPKEAGIWRVPADYPPYSKVTSLSLKGNLGHTSPCLPCCQSSDLFSSSFTVLAWTCAGHEPDIQLPMSYFL